MRRLLVVLMIISSSVFMLVPVPAHAQGRASKGVIRRNENAIANHYIVVLKGGSSSGPVSAAASDLARSYSASINHLFEFAIKGFAVEMSEANALALSRNPLVDYVEEDAEISGDPASAVTLSQPAGFSMQTLQPGPAWGLDRIDQRDLPLDNAYSYTNTGAGVNVYVIGTGIRFSHQEFGGRALRGVDTVGDGRDGDDCNGLGTAVAATIGGATYGVAKGVTLYSVRAFNCSNGTTVANLVAGIDWVAGNHVSPAVAHVSISTGGSATIDAAVSNSIASGVTYAVAAGDINVDAGTRSPARVAEAITVGGTNTIDSRVSTSNFGAGLDVFGPGQDILTASISGDTASTTRTGTALAAAHVAGVAARYLQSNPTDAPAAVGQAIAGNATTGRVLDPGTGSPNRLLYKPNSKIAFVSYRDGTAQASNPEIYSMNLDGTNQTRLTNSAGYDSNPVWSPDGSKIAFESNRNGNLEIFVMNSNGTNPINLSNNPQSDYHPSWSPDGLKIAFVGEAGGYLSIYVMNSDGSNQVYLSDTGDRTRLSNQAPSWSPDGTKIAFSRGVPKGVIDVGNRIAPDQGPGNSEIFVINSDGTDLTRLTYSDEVDEYLPVWSPNGTKIAYQTNTPNDLRAGYDELYVMNADGSKTVGITTSMYGPTEATFSDWSPDSTRVAFYNSQSYTVNADNTNLTTLTDNTVAGSGFNPIFLPDGARLLFTTYRNGNYDIYVMNADGSGQTRLTNNPADDFGQVLQPM